MRSLFLFTLALSILSLSANAEQRLLASDGDKAHLYIEDNYRCAKQVAINVVAKSAGYFDQDAIKLQRKIAATASGIIGFECSSVAFITINGLVGGTLVFKGEAQKSKRWGIQTEPAPLEQIALLMSLQEPSFLLLGFLQDQLKPYRDVEGILTSYQYDAYEKQIHRFMSIVDGDIDAFEDYLSKAHNFERFNEASKHYADILDIIKEYDSDKYPSYKIVYDTALPNLKTDFWEGKLSTIIGNDVSMTQIVSDIKSFVETSNNAEFKEFADKYLSDWVNEEHEFIKADINDAPLYEIEWATNFIAGFPDSYPFDTFPRFSTTLEKTGDTLSPVIAQRLSALEQLALDTIKEAGTTYESIDTLFETGFALASEFDEAGFTDSGTNILAQTVIYINQVLDDDRENFQAELAALKLTTESISALQQQSLIFEELSGSFSSYAPYIEDIENTINSGKDSLCVRILEDAGAWSQDIEKYIQFGDEKKLLPNLACELYENGHTLTEVNWDWWSPQTYFITIRDADGAESRFELSGDSYLYADTLSVVKRFEEDAEQGIKITNQEWGEYIARLTLPPPSGKPDANDVRECDRLAADPFDPQKRAAGIDFSSDAFGEGEDDFDNFDRAIDACIAAVENDAADPTQLYQLGRLFWYSGDPEQAKLYIDDAVARNYAPAKFYQAQMLLSSSEDQNDFVDAMTWLKHAGEAGYTRASKMLKELNPEGIEFFKEISPPTGNDIMTTFTETSKSASFLGITTYAAITSVQVKDCFQISATDFSCEYKKVMSCGMRGAGGFAESIMNRAMQSDCNSVYPEFESFRKLNEGEWEKIN
jgi:hypothetical protein